MSLPAAFRTAEGGALLAAQPGAPVQDLLIDPKTGQVVGRQAAPNSVTLTLVTSTAQDQAQHSADLRVAVAPPRTGVPQPTVLPPRHDQQVRPSGGPVPRVVAAAPRPPRLPLPIQLPSAYPAFASRERAKSSTSSTRREPTVKAGSVDT